MTLEQFFESRKGTGVLATSGKDGKADIAIYATPHVVSPKKIALIMRDRLSYRNVTANPKAAYMFLEDKPGHKGLRLYLTRTGEEPDKDKILAMRKRSKPLAKGGPLHLVYFRVDKAREIVGDKTYTLSQLP